MEEMYWLEEEQKVVKDFLYLTDFTRNNSGLMARTSYSFSKKERLTSKKKIEELFKHGSSFYLSAFQVRFSPSMDDHATHQVLISVPKRNFKRAVDRNLLKRRIREAYRLNKSRLEDIKPLYIGFVYISKQILTFHEIQDQLIQSLDRLKRSNTD